MVQYAQREGWNIVACCHGLLGLLSPYQFVCAIVDAFGASRLYGIVFYAEAVLQLPKALVNHKVYASSVPMAVDFVGRLFHNGVPILWGEGRLD